MASRQTVLLSPSASASLPRTPSSPPCSWNQSSSAEATGEYYFYGYMPVSDNHSTMCQSKPDGIELPHPLRWWPPAGYSTASTWYKLGTSLNTYFQAAVRNAESNWEDLWGGGTEWFHFYEDTTPITDSTDRAIGMSTIPFPGVVAQGYWIETNSWHPYQYNGRVNRNVHELIRWYMRFQSDMTKLPTGEPSPEYWYWGSGDAAWCLDRESIATHEMGHIIPLMHPYEGGINWDDPQTMMSGFPYADRSGTYARTPNDDDAFGFLKLYPPIDQID